MLLINHVKKASLVIGIVPVGVEVDGHWLRQTFPQPVVLSQEFFPVT